MKVYKVTDQVRKKGKVIYVTKNGTKWGPGVRHTIKEQDEDQALCSVFWLHAYQSPLVAAVLHPMHTSFDKPTLWEAEGGGVFKYQNDKMGVTELTTIKKIRMPKFTKEQLYEIQIRVCLSAMLHCVRTTQHAKTAVKLIETKRPMGVIPRRMVGAIQNAKNGLRGAQFYGGFDNALYRLRCCDGVEGRVTTNTPLASVSGTVYHVLNGDGLDLPLHSIIEGVLENRPFNGRE